MERTVISVLFCVGVVLLTLGVVKRLDKVPAPVPITSTTVTSAYAGVSECGVHFFVVVFDDGTSRLFTPPALPDAEIQAQIDQLPEGARRGIRVNCVQPLGQIRAKKKTKGSSDDLGHHDQRAA